MSAPSFRRHPTTENVAIVGPHSSMLTGGNYKRHHFKSTPNLVTIRFPMRGVNANAYASNTTCLRPPSHKTAASPGSPHVTCPTPRSPQARENTNGNIRRTWSFFVIQHKESVVPGPIPPVLQPNPKTNYPPLPPRLGFLLKRPCRSKCVGSAWWRNDPNQNTMRSYSM